MTEDQQKRVIEFLRDLLNSDYARGWVIVEAHKLLKEIDPDA